MFPSIDIGFLFRIFIQNQYSLARAQQSFRSLVQIHEKNGDYFTDNHSALRNHIYNCHVIVFFAYLQTVDCGRGVGGFTCSSVCSVSARRHAFPVQRAFLTLCSVTLFHCCWQKRCCINYFLKSIQILHLLMLRSVDTLLIFHVLYMHI